MKTILVIVLCLAAFGLSSKARVVTFFTRTPYQTNCITVREFETFKVLSGVSQASFNVDVSITKEGWKTFIGLSQLTYPPTMPWVLTGPLEIRLESYLSPSSMTNWGGAAWITFEILPETYTVDKSVTVGPGPGGAVVALETSTNLVDWSAVSTGTYTNLPDARFFRIKAERVPCQ